MPFDCLDGDDDNRDISDGIVEYVITNLARFQALHVISRNSSFAYRALNPPIQQIGL